MNNNGYSPAARITHYVIPILLAVFLVLAPDMGTRSLFAGAWLVFSILSTFQEHLQASTSERWMKAALEWRILFFKTLAVIPPKTDLPKMWTTTN